MRTMKEVYETDVFEFSGDEPCKMCGRNTPTISIDRLMMCWPPRPYFEYGDRLCLVCAQIFEIYDDLRSTYFMTDGQLDQPHVFHDGSCSTCGQAGEVVNIGELRVGPSHPYYAFRVGDGDSELLCRRCAILHEAWVISHRKSKDKRRV